MYYYHKRRLKDEKDYERMGQNVRQGVGLGVVFSTN